MYMQISVLLRVVCIILLSFVLSTKLFAQTCDLSDSDFPSEECSFTGLGIDPQTLKFAIVDHEPDAGPGAIIEFGSARFTFSSSVVVHEVNDDEDCDIEDLNEIDVDDQVAFVFNPSSPRQIIRIWILDCTVVQER